MSHYFYTKKPSESCEKSALILHIEFATTPKTVLLLHPISSAKGINPHNNLGAFQEYLWPQNAHCIAKLREGVNLNSFLLPRSQSMLATRKMLGQKTRVGRALIYVPVTPGPHRLCSTSTAVSTSGKQRGRTNSSDTHPTWTLLLDCTKWTLPTHRLTLSRCRGWGTLDGNVWDVEFILGNLSLEVKSLVLLNKAHCSQSLRHTAFTEH